ncbi:DUF2975 domain-containing protein [Alteraurantiacibacter buctensis]|uniref:DUF2975 domain-containing protein n=1 Tax=Alteraurantiacibacter buctensis TaxID=1503981 RepID=A0A844YTW5_9SPHN|nr:DUF2975 domain-containing protein [Alteraurantiacibacter buctensis]MXO70308.1 DUF2975 domain-containing protein [Alteraurantiacibacter buctensis]
MKTALNDPLLTVARVATWVVQVMLLIAQVALGVAIAAVVIAALGYLPDNATVSGIDHLQPAALWAAALAMALVLAALGMATQFVVRLRQIIDTVGEGDPFVADNARRLTRMAWLIVIGQVLTIIAGAIGTWIEATDGAAEFDLEFSISLSGFILALILFILARVFRKGAEMRAELEGTV